jgi:hypothetical protein
VLADVSLHVLRFRVVTTGVYSKCVSARPVTLLVLQALLMGGSILGPGNIFLMLVGAFVAAFKIDNWTSFLFNMVPILIYMFVCFLCKSNIQVIQDKLII